MHVNKISGTIPFTIGALTALRDLQLWGNQLTGPLPSSMGLMTTLKLLGLHYNLLTGALKQFCPLIAQFEGKTCSLGQKVGTFNGFTYTKTWSDSNQCSNCMSNTRVGEGGCDFANGGTASSDWEYQIPVTCTNVDPNPACNNNQMAECTEYLACQSNVATCTVLNLERRGLIGTLPDSIGLLTALERLYINGNTLSGTITDEIKKLTSLKTLWVQNNNFAGAASGICTVAPTVTEGCFLGRNPLWVDGAQCPVCLNIGNCHQDHTGMAALPVVCTMSSSTASSAPTPSPTLLPTPLPTSLPTPVPTPSPTSLPTPVPTPSPTTHPTLQPTPLPTIHPTPLTDSPTTSEQYKASVRDALSDSESDNGSGGASFFESQAFITLVALGIGGIFFTLLLTFGTVVCVTALIRRSDAAGRASAADVLHQRSSAPMYEMHGNPVSHLHANVPQQQLFANPMRAMPRPMRRVLQQQHISAPAAPRQTVAAPAPAPAAEPQDPANEPREGLDDGDVANDRQNCTFFS